MRVFIPSLAFDLLALLAVFAAPVFASPQAADAAPVTVLSPSPAQPPSQVPFAITIQLREWVTPDQVSVSLNGQDITGSFHPEGECQPERCILTASAGIEEGAKNGENSIAATYQNSNDPAVPVTTTFAVPAYSLAADPGPSQNVAAGQTVFLNGLNSIGNYLTYSWTVVPPKGSGAITQLSGATPSFKTDVPGIYAATLTVSDGLTTSAPATVRIYAPASTAQINFVTRSLCPGCDPALAASYFMELKGVRYPFGLSGPVVPGVKVLILDRATLGWVYDGFANSAAGIQTLLNTYAPDNRRVAILASSTLGPGFSLGSLAPTLEVLGATTGFRAAGALIFSFIGIRGANPGQASETASGSGILTGSFVPDSQGKYAFAHLDYIPFSVTPSNTGPATVTIGSTVYSSPAPLPNRGGFLLVAVERESLSASPSVGGWVKSYETLSETPTASIQNQNNLSFDLGSLASGRYALLVFLVSYGSPHNGFCVCAPAYSNLARQVNNVGGTYELFNPLTIGDTYSMVWWPGGQTIESSSILDPTAPTGAIVGALGRINQGNWYAPAASSTLPSMNMGLYRLMSQPANAWPLPLTGRDQNAYEYLSRQLCSCADLRQGYYDLNVSLDTWARNLTSSTNPYPGNDPNLPFGDPEWGPLKDQMNLELGYASHIRQLYRNLENLWTQQNSNFGLLLTSALTNMQKQLPQKPKPDAQTLPVIGLALNTILTAGAAVVPAPPAKTVLGIVNGILQIGLQFAKDQNGNPAEDPRGSTVGGLAQNAANTFAQELTAMGTTFKTIYQDWGRLRNLGASLTDLSDPGWRWETVTSGQALAASSLAIETSLYQSFLALPNGLAVHQWFTTDPNNLNETRPDDWYWKKLTGVSKHPYTLYYAYKPWPVNAFQTSPIAQAGKQGAPLNEIRWVDGTQSNGLPVSDKGIVPSANLLNRLFSPVDFGGLGIYRPFLLRHWNLPLFVCKPSSTENAPCSRK